MLPPAALTALLVLTPLKALVAAEADLRLPLEISQLLLLLYMVIWLAHRIAHRQRLFVKSGGAIMAGLLALCAVFSLGTWTSESQSAWLSEWLKWLLMAFMAWHVSLSLRDAWRWLLFAVLLAACVNALVGLYIFFGGSGADHLQILGRFYRAFGTFGQPNPFGGFMGLALPLALTGAYSQARMIARAYRRRRHVTMSRLTLCACFAMASLLIAGALLASWSRGAWLGSGVALIVMLLALPRRVWHGLAAALAFALIVAMLWLTGLLPDAIVARATAAAGDFISIDDIRGVDISPENYAVMERVAHWQAALNMARTSPWLGVGLGNYEVVYDEHRLLNWEDSLGHAHNYYLNLLAESGIVGFAAYVAFWCLAGWQTWRIRRHPDTFARGIGIGLLGCWAYLAAHSLFDNLYVNNLFLHIGVLLGLAAILARQVNESATLE